jgi:hypothetical protein
MGSSVAESVNGTEVWCVKFVVKNSCDLLQIIECDSHLPCGSEMGSGSSI